MKTQTKLLLPLSFLLLLSLHSSASFNWSRKADFGGGNREQAVGFAIGNYGYAGCGKNPTDQNDFWQYDQVLDQWTQKANYPGSGRYGMVGFSIGSFGYIGTGWAGSGGGGGQFKDFWQYDPSNNVWIQKADFGGAPRYSAVGFSIGNKGYIGLGYSPLHNDFWEYDPSANSWVQKANFPSVRQAATGFGLGSKGYVGTGYNNGTSYKDFYEFDPVSNTWTAKSSVPGLRRRGAVSFAIGSYGYLGMGYNDTTYLTDFSRYDPTNDTWTEIASIGGVPRYASFAFANNSYGFVGTGSYGGIISVISTPVFYRLEDCDGTGVGIIENPRPQKSISVSVSADHRKNINLHYDLGEERDAEFKLFDESGRLVLQVALVPGTSSMNLSVLLSQAMYFYTVSNPEANLASGKVVVN